MEKTKLMLEYERETRETLDMSVLSEDASGSWYGFLDMMDENATAYDRLMSGGRKTLKEWANFFGRPVAIDAVGDGCFSMVGISDFTKDDDCWLMYRKSYIPYELIRYEGKWDESYTVPDGWEEK